MGEDREVAEVTGIAARFRRIGADGRAPRLRSTVFWRRARLGLVAVLCAGGLSCSKGEPVREAEIERAKAALAPFKQELLSALREGLNEGAEGAIDICRVRAPEIAAERSTDGVMMGRTSHRLRNPGNAPEPWMRPFLDEYIERKDDRTFRAVRLGDGSVGYVEPIYVQPMCLACHGADIAPTVAERLDAAYPDDGGRGFAAGEFRGLFWVRLAKTP